MNALSAIGSKLAQRQDLTDSDFYRFLAELDLSAAGGQVSGRVHRRLSDHAAAGGPALSSRAPAPTQQHAMLAAGPRRTGFECSTPTRFRF